MTVKNFKAKIRSNFDKASNLYESSSWVQKQSAKFLVEKLRDLDPLFYPQTILDLGTGTGYIPELLINYYPNAFYTLNDIAPKMIAVAKNKFATYNNFTFCIDDIENIDFKNQDLIVSNLALQWIDNLFEMLQKLCKKSKVLAFSCLLDGTFCEWNSVLQDYGLISATKKYPTLEELILFCNQLKTDKLHFEVKNFKLNFANSLLFMKYLKKIGAGTVNSIAPINVLKSLILNNKRPLEITYKVFFGIIKNN